MKKLILFSLLLAVTTAFAAPRVVEIHTEKRKNAEGKDETFWAPERIEVVPGEKIQIVAKHELTGGFPMHGLTIEPLNVHEQVMEKVALKLDREVPKDLKVGTLVPVTCHLHAAHKPASLVVVQKITAKP